MSLGARAHLVVLLVTLGVGCGSSTPNADSGFDAGVESDLLRADLSQDLITPDLLPPVTPQGKRCADIDVPKGRRCIPAGFFALYRSWQYSSEPSLSRAFPAYLDAFLVDTHEVTNGEYAAFVASGGAAPLPEFCGLSSPLSYFSSTYDIERSGWSGGKPDSTLVEHPVICVTRGEARAYCAAKGGLLPTAVQWIRAALGDFPDLKAYPWGNDPCPNGPCDQTNLPAAYSPSCKHDLCNEPAGSYPTDTSVHGVVDLAGSVSEFLRDCDSPEPQFTGVDGKDGPHYIRPTVPDLASCAGGVVFAGASWRTVDAPVRFEVNRAGSIVEVKAGEVIHLGYRRVAKVTKDLDIGFNNLRSWHIGFRCVYPLP